jgi:hypothetical protein
MIVAIVNDSVLLNSRSPLSPLRLLPSFFHCRPRLLENESKRSDRQFAITKR